ncbi:MAG: NUDIX hydrolase [Pseudolabrys sp.]|nr:NUDIX hydrolase [Pseudolabrys sp.]MDP2295987.1 NUDIX hydrolase [Pseudolabrys sp.]
MSDSATPAVRHVDRLDLSFDAGSWDFAAARRAEIDALFAELRRAKPALFNGRVLLMHRFAIADGVMHGTFLEADYAAFVAWQRWGRPDAGVLDCFGAAAIQSADGAFLLGVMGGHTFNAGQIYFPCGTPDPSDVIGGTTVDFDFSIRRELREETGLDPALLRPEPGWTLAVDGSLIAAVKVLRSELTADVLRARILGNLAREPQPELADIRIVRGPADFDPAMRGYVTAFLTHRFSHAHE